MESRTSQEDVVSLASGERKGLATMKGGSRGGQLIGTSPSGGSRLVVDVMSYRKRRAGRTSVCHGHLPPIRELGCYVDLNRSFYEVPRLDVEQNFRWELMAQSVDVILGARRGLWRRPTWTPEQVKKMWFLLLQVKENALQQ